MEGLLLRVLSLSLTCSAVILPLLLLGKGLRRRYAAQSLSLVWLLLAVRLLVPVKLALPQAPVSVPVPRYVLNLPVAQVPPTVPNPSGVVVTVTTELEVTALLAALWLAGMAVFLLYQCAVYLLARRALLRGSRAGAPVQGVPVMYAPRAETAMTLGVLRPVLVLPEGTVDDLDLVLRHELCHLRRRDAAYKALLLLCNAVHWFNPLVWLMTREAGENLEFCCDDEVLLGADGAQRRQYGEVLLRAAAGGRAPTLATRFGSSKEKVKERMMNLYQEKKRGVALVAILVGLVAALGLLVAFRPVEAPPLPEKVAPIQMPVQTGGPDLLANDSAENFMAVLDAPMGVDFPKIDCVSSKFLVFHDYWGLAVFDFRQGQIVRLLDTPSIGMNLIQGDQYTQVRVGQGFERIYLYNTPGERIAYCYLLEGDTVQEVPLAQARGEAATVSDPVGTFLFPEGAEPLMKNLVYQASDGSEWSIFETAEQWYWPLEESYTITSTYGARIHPITGVAGNHSGMDIQAEQGAWVLAAQSGTVTQVGFDNTLGNFVELDHGNGILTRYAALESYEVAQGDTVEKGQVIGAVGSTGSSTGSHLHLEFRNGAGNRLDPLSYYNYNYMAGRLRYR